MSNTPRILDIEIELPLLSNSIIVDEKIAEHNADEEAHPYILGVLEGKANSADLATVATTGDYDDLENKPDISDIATNVAGGVVSTHNESETAHSDIRNEIGTVKSIAEGANIAIVFDSYSALVTFFNAESDSLKVGTNLYVKTIDVPDLWISAVESTSVSYTYTTDQDFLDHINNNGQIGYYKFSELETQKVDLSNYATLTDLGTKVSKSGDTMTGDLTLDGSSYIIKVSSTQLWRIRNNQTHLEVMYSANGGSSWSVKQRLYATQDRALFSVNNVYVGNQPTDENYRLLPHSEIDNPAISTSVTLVGGVTHLNELGAVDYATITLPSSPGTAEYNGSFTSTTSGDITVSLPLTYWQGETNIVSGRTYSFTIQNGRGFIIQMN